MTSLVQPSSRVAALLERIKAARASHGRLIFALDATASREPTWDMAAQLQASMFAEAAAIGGLNVQLVFYRGTNEVSQSPWFTDAGALVSMMGKIRCQAGATQIARVLRHIKTENAIEKVDAAVFIGDAVEESERELCDLAAGLGVPLLIFQEGTAIAFTGDGSPRSVEQVFRGLTTLSGGAYARFDSGAAKQLGELLHAVAAFACGGLTALANQNSASARLLLAQLK